ncbi:unnamed protein product [Hydatigera taeniaeformis]|uniref:RRM domain-containing protein n=1 Tax=Hydatigena taeniaeformis TaxID=6205 RepID=A0A0R3WLJ6_HYDTA|nr:unnamed protein product [Hydatigera taeniaeformis]
MSSIQRNAVQAHRQAGGDRDKLVRGEIYSRRESRYPNAVALGLRKPLKAVPASGLLLYARSCLKRQHNTTEGREAETEEAEEMSTNLMLPPAPPQQLNNGSTCRIKVDPQSQQQQQPQQQQHHQGVEETNEAVNLNDESMMALSQSVDSIHTVGTAAGSDALDCTLFSSPLSGEEAGWEREWGREEPVVHFTLRQFGVVKKTTTSLRSSMFQHQVRTLFVSGLPLDTKSRELYLLFRGFKGYLSSTLKPAGKNGKLTAPVGFVTFETREQAENALNELQVRGAAQRNQHWSDGSIAKGIKFDPEGNQHMRLEFARSNTKVTKPKWPPGFPLPPGAPSGFPFIPATGNPASLSPLGQQAGFPGVLPTNFLPHLAGFDPTTMALIAAQDATQWTANPHFGYDSTGLFTSIGAAPAAAFLQASNFRPILSMNAGGTTPVSQSGATPVANHLQLVQAALQATNAAAALGLMATGGSGNGGAAAALQQQASGPTPQGSSPTGSAISSGNHSQTTYSALQNHQQQQQQQQFLATNPSVQQQHQQQQQHQRQQAALAAAAASVGLPAGLLPGVLSGLTTPSGLKEEHNQNGTSVAVGSPLNHW